jgi:hypothetical protein
MTLLSTSAPSLSLLRRVPYLVEVAELPDLTAIRDLKDRSGPVLSFAGSAWSGFTSAIRTGQLD